jgi:hypothetical protein
VKRKIVTRRILFQVLSPLGYKVVLTRDRWREIVRYKQPALAGYETSMQQCIEEPETIRESAKDASVHLYYADTRRGYLCVVVGPSGDGTYFVITGYFCKELKKGRQLWTK